jgi:hypothetical protein
LILVSDAQVKTTQRVLREVNERVAEITLNQGENESGFLCECGRHDCAETIVLSIVDYQSLRMGGDFYLAAPGHGVDGVDRLVESRDGFDILVQA